MLATSLPEARRRLDCRRGSLLFFGPCSFSYADSITQLKLQQSTSLCDGSNSSCQISENGASIRSEFSFKYVQHTCPAQECTRLTQAWHKTHINRQVLYNKDSTNVSKETFESGKQLTCCSANCSSSEPLTQSYRSSASSGFQDVTCPLFSRTPLPTGTATAGGRQGSLQASLSAATSTMLLRTSSTTDLAAVVREWEHSSAACSRDVLDSTEAASDLQPQCQLRRIRRVACGLDCLGA